MLIEYVILFIGYGDSSNSFCIGSDFSIVYDLCLLIIMMESVRHVFVSVSVNIWLLVLNDSL